MKDKIFSALQTKYAGVDDKTLERIAAKVAKTLASDASEDDIKTAVDGISIRDLMENYGDFRSTDATKTAVANYEKKHGIKDGKPIEKPEPPKPDGDDEPAWVKTLLEKQSALETKLATLEAEKLGNGRKATLESMLKDAPENIRKVYEANFANMTFADDAAFTGWIDEQKPIVEQLANDFKAKGASVHSPRGGSSERKAGEADPLVVARAEKAAKAAEAAPSVFLGKPQ